MTTFAKLALVLFLTSASSAIAETEADLAAAIQELESVKLGGTYKVAPGATACSDKSILMFVERMATGDQADQSAPQLIAA